VCVSEKKNMCVHVCVCVCVCVRVCAFMRVDRVVVRHSSFASPVTASKRVFMCACVKRFYEERRGEKVFSCRKTECVCTCVCACVRACVYVLVSLYVCDMNIYQS